MKKNLQTKSNSGITHSVAQRSSPVSILFVGSLDDLDDVQSPTTFVRPVLLVKKATGGMLVGSGVALAIGNLVAGCSGLLFGPELVLSFLG